MSEKKIYTGSFLLCFLHQNVHHSVHRTMG